MGLETLCFRLFKRLFIHLCMHTSFSLTSSYVLDFFVYNFVCVFVILVHIFLFNLTIILLPGVAERQLVGAVVSCVIAMYCR